jgi:hypothetical protein
VTIGKQGYLQSDGKINVGEKRCPFSPIFPIRFEVKRILVGWLFGCLVCFEVLVMDLRAHLSHTSRTIASLVCFSER